MATKWCIYYQNIQFSMFIFPQSVNGIKMMVRRVSLLVPYPHTKWVESSKKSMQGYLSDLIVIQPMTKWSKKYYFRYQICPLILIAVSRTNAWHMDPIKAHHRQLDKRPIKNMTCMDIAICFLAWMVLDKDINGL